MPSAVLSSMRVIVGHALGVALVLGLLAAPACKPKSPTTPPTDTAGDSPGNDPAVPDPDSKADGPSAQADPDAPPECAAQGEPWDGRQDTCLYEHHGCCYPDPASLCAAAGCTDDNCSILESHPAQAACAAVSG